jgi:hypothetical protein
VCDRLPNDIDLASQPTLSRFENAVSIANLWRLRDALCDEFLDAFPGLFTSRFSLGRP